MININRPLYYNRAKNQMFDKDIVESVNAVEPVSLVMAKKHLKITYNDDDLYLNIITKAARQAVENFTGLSLVEKTITWHGSNVRGDVDLPYGPIRTITSIKDVDDNVIASADYKMTGINFRSIDYPTYSFLKVVYVVGYTTDNIPADLVLAILEEIAYRESNRGDTGTTNLSTVAKGYAKSYRRVPVIV